MGSINFINLEYIFLWIYLWLKSFNLVAILQWFINILAPIRPLGFFITFILVLFCAYCIIRLWELEKQTRRNLYGEPKSEGSPAQEHKPVNQKWLKIEEHAHSQNPSDWRQAILECDIILAELLHKLDYHGDSIGEQLKAVNPADMATLNDAWEAHKVRNMIAHEGIDFQLNERETKRVVELYKKVFEEFNYL